MTISSTQSSTTTEPPTPSPNGCPRIDKWFGACEFKPRYDTKPILPEDFSLALLLTIINADNLELITNLLAGLKSTTYVQDVCTTCGRVVKREG